jgi:hypothetical protein
MHDRSVLAAGHGTFGAAAGWRSIRRRFAGGRNTERFSDGSRLSEREVTIDLALRRLRFAAAAGG